PGRRLRKRQERAAAPPQAAAGRRRAQCPGRLFVVCPRERRGTKTDAVSGHYLDGGRLFSLSRLCRHNAEYLLIDPYVAGWHILRAELRDAALPRPAIHH